MKTSIQGLVFAVAVKKTALARAPTVGERQNWKPDTRGPESDPDGACLAGSDGIPGTSGPDSHPGSSSTRDICGPEEVCLSGHSGKSSIDQDNYSSYLTLVATISGDSSEDEGLQQAIVASMESCM